MRCYEAVQAVLNVFRVAEHLQVAVVPLPPQLVHDAVRLLHHDLHLVVLVCHGLHLPHRVHQVLPQLLVVRAQVGPVFLRTLGRATTNRVRAVG